LGAAAGSASMKVQTALSWSAGKDSALTLWALRREGVEPGALITTVTDAYERISMHGVRRELLLGQAEAVGIPLVWADVGGGAPPPRPGAPPGPPAQSPGGAQALLLAALEPPTPRRFH
jgi:diphthamide synthase (EF-2-diphthine--ammonia ligase)